MNHITKRLTLNEVIQVIESRTGLPARRSGCGYILRCPAHDDKNPSLSISQSIDNKILLKCFAGCSFNDICEVLDLYPSSFFGARNIS